MSEGRRTEQNRDEEKHPWSYYLRPHFQIKTDRNIVTPTTEQKKIREGQDISFENIFKEIQERKGSSTKQENIDFKKKIKKVIRERKYKIQGEDFERVKKIKEENLERTGSGYEPVRQNIYWNKARKSYEDAWACLRAWAKTQNTQEQNVWDENDEREFFHEIGETDPTLYKALRTQHRDALVSGILGGAAYGVKALVMFAGKGLVEQTVKFMLNQLMHDSDTTKKMLEMIFGKHEKEKDKKGGKKEQKDTKAKEDENRMKVKQAEIAYREGIMEELAKNFLLPEETTYAKLTTERRKQVDAQITEKIKDDTKRQITKNFLRQDETDATLTPERREELVKELKEQLEKINISDSYKKAWTDMRRFWIAKQMWNDDDEKKFREDVINFAPENEDQVLVYMLTPEEFNNLIKNQNQLANQEQKTDDAAFQTKKKEWEETVQKIKETKKEIEDEEDATQKETKREELEKLKRIERVKHRPILSREDLHRRIDATIEKAKKRADDNTFNSWPPFTQNAKENTEQEALITQDQEDEVI